jgi:hypothetical protein
MKINPTAISVLVLAISVFSSALIISNSLNTNDNSVPASVEHEEEFEFNKQLLTKEEISSYLGITPQEFDELDKTQIAYVGRGIPFLISENAKYYTIQGVEEWLSDSNYYQTNDLSDF